ncbi:MAG: alpha-L-rhamnosidase-related protein, partial [Planctomycetota bacterium]
GKDKWKVKLDASHPERAAALTFEMEEQMVGWPRFSIEAPAGTVVELMVHEGHAPGGAPLLNTYFHSWARFICREGRNEFETFDFECCRWIQLHIRNADGEIKISNVGMRRRVFPWKVNPKISLSEPALQRLMNAGINTLNNCAQETCVDGMGRERQQYSGDGSHQLHAILMTMGEHVLPARFLRTFSQGITISGCFLDSWPAYDRLNRLSFREIGLGKYGTIIDHGIGFNFDCMYHYLYTGDLTVLEEPYPRLQKFAHYLKSIQKKGGLLAVDDIGIGSVWIDHSSFKQQRHKQCAFNLYAAAMLKNAYAVLCKAFGDSSEKEFAETFSEELYQATVKHFWSEKHRLFVDNLPWLKKEKNIRLHDRTLATSLLFDQCPQGQTAKAIKVLVDCPPIMGFSYPCNAGWRLWALGKTGRADVILKELRFRWAKMDSVLLNNTLQEGWRVRPDSRTMWSHCAVVPLYVLHMCIAGIRPLSPGFERCEIRPQLAELEKLKLTTYTVKGPINFSSEGSIGNRQITITMPQKCCGELVVKKQEKLNLEIINTAVPPGHVRYRLPKNRKVSFQLKYS